jgi:hypothetical protein
MKKLLMVLIAAFAFLSLTPRANAFDTVPVAWWGHHHGHHHWHWWWHHDQH